MKIDQAVPIPGCNDNVTVARDRPAKEALAFFISAVVTLLNVDTTWAYLERQQRR